MLTEVSFQRTLSSKKILALLSSSQRRRVRAHVRKLQGKKIVHVNSTSHGGGVAEVLRSLIPYLQALGVDSSWYAINERRAGKAFFDFTNRLHNALQGSDLAFSAEEWKLYEQVNEDIARDLKRVPHDILVVHDPQPLPVAHLLGMRQAAVCVLHIDISSPEKSTWRKIRKWVQSYERVLLSNKHFVNKDIPRETLRILPPAIDPLAPKQIIVSQRKAKAYLAGFGIPQRGPLIVQVSRFDVWKNPHGLVEAFWLLQKKHPKASLMFVGFQEARDNPQAEKVYMDIRDMVGKDPRISLFFSPNAIGGEVAIGEFTTMAQNAADIVVQNSVREGFGLTVAEAMWKGKPVVGGPAAGIRRQIRYAKNGYIAPNTKRLAKLLDYLLSNAKERKRIGKAARQSVRKNFLMPRFVLDHLKVYAELFS